ncbi:MAG: ribosomal protein S18-alanine N-acetyltransferase [Deltaproteobacteria bacterium]|jgi:ribosomal-protein-alanine acetyltransferase|nr:ribosomal protein S18-alanine N-acetyltransferase [Deltaproteobacteria bacterium]
MKINFLDLKEFASQSSSPEFQILTEYVIREMFDLHKQASKTVWERKMFDDELKRGGSGFLICYSDAAAGAAAGIGGGGSPEKFTVKDIDVSIKLDLQSQINGFFIFYNVLDEMHILDITVAKNMQSKGIGSLMLDRIIKINAEGGIKYFFLEVRTSNLTAVSLYKKFGFKIFMLRKNYYEDNGEDALCMVKEL